MRALHIVPLLIAPALALPVRHPGTTLAHSVASVPVSVRSDTTAYAGEQRWFVDGAPIVFGGRAYVKFGMSQTLVVSDVERAGVYRGIHVYRQKATGRGDGVIYLPVRAGCDFQPYRPAAQALGVRG